MKARAAREAQKQKLIAAAKALMKIAADELGITAALDCFTSGNLGACAETAVNVVSSFAGGLAGKLMAKYGAPWKWAKGARLVKTLWKIGSEAVDAIKGWFKAGKEVEALETAATGALHAEGSVLTAVADSCPIGNSFAPNTPVLMSDGTFKPISSVGLGERVLAADPRTGEVSPEPVTATIVGEGRKSLVRIASQDGALTATTGHPLWVANREDWIDAGKVLPGDQLLAPNGARVHVVAVRTWTALARVNNLGVSRLHSYFVALGSRTVLVHNCGSAFADLANMRSGLDLPAAGSSADKSTLARLDVNGDSFYGINGHGQSYARPAGVTHQTMRHAEGDAFGTAARAGVKGGSGTLYVDRVPCNFCRGGLAGLARSIDLDDLTVVTPAGVYGRYTRGAGFVRNR